MSEYEAANAVVLGLSFDSVAEQKKFAEDEGFPYRLLSDPDKAVGQAYDAVRVEGEKYFEAGIPRRISYLIDPQGQIHKAYDIEAEGLDLGEHATKVLEDIKAGG